MQCNVAKTDVAKSTAVHSLTAADLSLNLKGE